MPFKSEKQRRWMHANEPEMAERWEKETPNRKLPEKVEDDRRSEKQKRREGK